jgi:lipoprotein-releasing system ATP-binding protein
MTHVLQADGLGKDYAQGKGVYTVFNELNVAFDQNRSYALIGASGSGKSTLLHVVSGLDVPTRGRVLFDGLSIASFDNKTKEELLNKQFGFIFQFHYLIKELTVLNNVIMPGLINGMSLSHAQQKGEMLLEYMAVLDKKDDFPTRLSGGEQQRVSIARALFNEPAFLFADEPTGNLDEENAQKVLELLLSCKKKWGMGLIVCSHDEAIYKSMDVVMRLHHGNLTRESK